MNNQQKPMTVLERIASRSQNSYESVASRMRKAAQIADAMKAAGISKKQLADSMHKQPSEVTKWLSGTHNFTQKTLLAISAVLKVDVVGEASLPLVFAISDNSYRALSVKQETGAAKSVKVSVRPKWGSILSLSFVSPENNQNYGFSI